MGRRYHWLLDIELGGQTVRLAETDLEVTSALGVLRYDAGLLGELDAIARGDEPTITMFLPAGVDPLRFEHSHGILRLWREDQALEEASVYAEGVVTDLEYGATDDPVQCVIAPYTEDAPQIPDAQAVVVDGETWPITAGEVVVEEHAGMYYPVIYGYPGERYGVTTTTGTTYVVPVPLAQHNATDFNDTLLVIADQPLKAGTSGNTVGVANFGSDPFTLTTQSWRYVADLTGRLVTVADFSADHSAQVGNNASQAEFYAGFSRAGGGGRCSDAYAVIVDVLQRWGGARHIDYQAMTGIEALLSRYRVDTWINEPTTAQEWLDSVLLPLLPVRWAQGRAGMYLAPDPYFATALDVRRAIDIGQRDGERRSPVRVNGRALANEVAVVFWRSRTSGHWGRRILTAQSENLSKPWFQTGADERIIAHPLAAASQARYGLHRAPELEVDWTWDAGTALLVAQDQLERRALPIETVAYWLADEVDQGDVLAVTDTELGWVERLAVVSEAPLWVGDGWTATLRLVPAV